MIKFNKITVEPPVPPKDVPILERDVQIRISSEGTLVVSIDGWDILGITAKGNLKRYGNIHMNVGLQLDSRLKIIEVPEIS